MQNSFFDPKKIYDSIKKNIIDRPLLKEQEAIIRDVEIRVPFALPLDIDRIRQALSAAGWESGVQYNEAPYDEINNMWSIHVAKDMKQVAYDVIKSAVFDGAEMTPEDKMAPQIIDKEPAFAVTSPLGIASLDFSAPAPVDPITDPMGALIKVAQDKTVEAPVEPVIDAHPVSDQIVQAAPGEETPIENDPTVEPPLTTDVTPAPEEVAAIEDEENVEEDRLIDPETKKEIEPERERMSPMFEKESMNSMKLLTEVFAKKLAGMNPVQKKAAIKLLAESLGMKAQVRKVVKKD